MRLYEVDELPSQYQLLAMPWRWSTYLVSGVMAVSVAAGVTFLIIRSMRERTPVAGAVHIESLPNGADVVFDGTRLTDKTPLTIDGAPVGTQHTIRLELARYEPAEEIIDIPKAGGRVEVTKALTPITGTLIVVSEPSNAEIWINRDLRGYTPKTIKGVDMDSVRQIELRLKDYQPFVHNLTQWPNNGKIEIEAKLVHVH